MKKLKESNLVSIEQYNSLFSCFIQTLAFIRVISISFFFFEKYKIFNFISYLQKKKKKELYEKLKKEQTNNPVFPPIGDAFSQMVFLFHFQILFLFN